MDVQTSNDFLLYIVGEDKPLNCGVEEIKDSGEITVNGALPEIRRLLVPFTDFKIVTRDGKQAVVLEATVLRVDEKAVYDVVARYSSDVSVTSLRTELLCNIEYCQLFEPLAAEVE